MLFLEPLEPRQLLSAASHITEHPQLLLAPQAVNTASIDGDTPAQIRDAYGLNQLSGDGTGQIIAIVDAFDDPRIASDLKTFDAAFNLPDPILVKVGPTGSTSTKKLPKSDGSWAQEIALDVELAHAAAPGAAILLVEAKSDNLSDLLGAVKVARNAPGVSVISMSWGGTEFSGQIADDKKYFTTPAGHAPITFLAASGDDGSAGGAEWPASSTNVIAVGGTSLTLANSAGTYGSESAWRSSSGGVSKFEPVPSFQIGVITAAHRATPDVSLNADPNTGFAVFDSFPFQGDSGWLVFGGTSASTPTWAGLVADADQLRNNAGLPTLDGPTQTLPTLYSLYTAGTTTYDASFHDIDDGSQGTKGGGGRHFGSVHRSSHSPVLATPGYDLVTGLGTPRAPAIVTALLTV